MEVKSLKHNFIMYSFRIISGVLFTLIVFPYVARILGPRSLGKIQFVESIVAYFLLFINLGIPSYGKREIAFIRDSKEKRSQLVLEILVILLITTFVVSILFFLSINYINSLKEYKVLLYLFSITIIFNFMSVEWFYMGVENQEYITKRSLIFKVLSSIAIFFFIKEREDYLIYSGILIFSLMGSNIFNFKKLFEYVDFNKNKIKSIDLKKHFKPILVLFTTSLATTVFTNLDSLMIKFFIDDTALGYYSLASKIGRMPLMVTTAIFTVLYPRLCNLINKKNYINYIKLGNKGLEMSLMIAIPSTIGMLILAPEIIEFMAGKEFLKAVNIFRAFSLLIVVMSMAVFTGQNLIANCYEKIYMKGQVIASITNVIFNFIFIPIFGVIGAAFGTILAESVAISYRMVFGKEIFKEFDLINKNKMKIVISGILMGICIYFIKTLLNIMLFEKLIILISTGVILYLSLLFLFKEKNTLEILGGKYEKFNKK